MSYKVSTISNFRKEAKRLIKKYPSLENELNSLGQELSQNPKLGTPIGNGCYKIRLAISSKGKGKSGGARVITYVYVSSTTLFLLSIYDKSEKNSLTKKKIADVVSRH